MPDVNDLVNDLTSSNQGAGVVVNDQERDGNVSDLLLRIDQATTSITGPTTTTTITSPTTVGDTFSALASGQPISLTGLVYIVLIILAGWWLLKPSK